MVPLVFCNLLYRGVHMGGLIMSSVLVDLKLRSLGLTPPGWLPLRLPLSIGLGFMTLVAGLI
jgi:hypothetical protein